LEWILSMQIETPFPECAVCTETLQPGACIMELPQCRHTFHETCALTWLQSHNTCPYCRHELPHETDGNRER
jgi:E3 ubiquitin-protein ligase RNF115/126